MAYSTLAEVNAVPGHVYVSKGDTVAAFAHNRLALRTWSGATCSMYLHTSRTPRNNAVSSCVLSERPAEAEVCCIQPVNLECLPSGQIYGLTTSCTLLAEKLIQQHAYASKMYKLCHDEEVVMVFYNQPHQEKGLHCTKETGPCADDRSLMQLLSKLTTKPHKLPRRAFSF